MEASGQTEARKVQGSIQHIPSRRNKDANAPVVQGSRSREHVPCIGRQTQSGDAAKAGRALRKMRESHFRGRHQGLAEGVKQPMEASGQTKARKGQGSIQHIPSRRKQECQCTGRARQQEQGAFPVYRTPNPIRGCVTRRETSKYGQGPAPQRATNNAPAAKAGRALRKTEEEPLTEISAKAALTIVTRG
ncbi:hypothetical protein V6N11_081658 [Hibiscus sabdariffa]|uniref:Uncharacterized protein n=2 Tax=Hibiscus sabdariffa TaxID=183260 RepID=A0ABR1ZBT6_9ROSI